MCAPRNNELPCCNDEVRRFVSQRLDKTANEMIAEISPELYDVWRHDVYDSPALLGDAPSLNDWKACQNDWMEGLHRQLQRDMI